MRTLNVTAVDQPQPKIYFAAEPNFLNWETLIWRFAAEKSYWVVSAGANIAREESFSTVPHAMPVWGIWHDCAFKFSTYPGSRKAQNLQQNPFATVHLGNTEAVFSMECRVIEVTETAELQIFVDEYNPKYKWNFMPADVRGGVFALTPYKAFAWAGGEGDAFGKTATRFSLNVTTD